MAGHPSVRDLEAKYGVSKSALQRHRQGCIAEVMAKAAEARDVALVEHGGDLLEQLEGLREEGRQILAEARSTNNPAVALRAIGSLGRLLELTGKLEGRLNDSATVNVNVSGSDLDQIRVVILDALGDHPDARKEWVEGKPDLKHVSTSYVERQNLTMRMHMRRFTRLTNAFSKKFENHAHMVALYTVWYNFVKQHRSLEGITPAMAAGVTDRLWQMKEIVVLIDAAVPRSGPRGLYKKRDQKAP
jgi:hypothetical protein